jgi:hypothetical protein
MLTGGVVMTTGGGGEAGGALVPLIAFSHVFGPTTPSATKPFFV